VNSGIDGERIEILRESRSHRGAPGGSAYDIECYAGFAKGAVNSDMG
jgi:hypothetical protein